eukprot:178711_1
MADVKYVGECNKGSGLWYGIEYVDGSLGKHNGVVNGERYFDGKNDRCVMIRAEKIRRTAYTTAPKHYQYTKKTAVVKRKKKASKSSTSSYNKSIIDQLTQFGYERTEITSAMNSTWSETAKYVVIL